MLAFSVLGWIILGVGALCAGLSKTALPGLGTVTVALFAAALPARESTAALLLLLLVGDIFAITAYRRSADWKTLRALVPAVLVGIIVGALFLGFVSNEVMKRAIGVILLVLIALALYQRYVAPDVGAAPDSQNGPASRRGDLTGTGGQLTQFGYGTLAGFTTMAANAGGPAMSLYLLSARFDVMRFLGTSAWFFFIVNVIKLPFSIGIGLIGVSTLQLAAVLAPFTILGALAGLWLAPKMTSEVFDPIVWVLTVVGAVALLI